MLNAIIDAFRRRTPSMSDELQKQLASLHTFLVPHPTANLILANAKQRALDLAYLRPAVVADDDGVVVLYHIDQTGGISQTTTRRQMMGNPDDPRLATVTGSTDRFVYDASTRYVVFQNRMGATWWCEGDCLLAKPELTSAGWIVKTDLVVNLDQIFMCVDGERPHPVGPFARAKNAESEALRTMGLDIASAVGAACEQLDHIGRGCSLRETSRGFLVLPE